VDGQSKDHQKVFGDLGNEKREKNVRSEKHSRKAAKNAGPPRFFHASGWGFVELEGHDLAPRSCRQNVIPPFKTRARGAHQAAMAPKRAPEWDHAKIHKV
jgi:hypothetical protein